MNKVQNKKISYCHSNIIWENFHEMIMQYIEKQNVQNICELGGGANPLFSENIINNKKLKYSILDINKKELEKSSTVYSKIISDITDEHFAIKEEFDLCFSKMLAEHVKNGRIFHSNVRQMLKPGGLAIHFFPTLYTIPFFTNFLFPEKITQILLRKMVARDYYRYAKFPAYYKWCRGPSIQQIINLEKLGYHVIEYIGCFGHEGYYEKFPILRFIHSKKTKFLLKYPKSLFTSYAFIVLKKIQ